MALDLNKILEFAAQKKISDVHLKQGRPPAFRVNGNLTSQKGAIPLRQDDMTGFLDILLSDDRKRKSFAETGSVDVAYELPEQARYRISIYRQYTGISLAIRTIPMHIKTIRDLSLPAVLEQIAEERRGLVLVTGTTGSGKSTTLAAVIDHINSTRSGHIITIEDPVEFVIPEKKCVVNQREVGASTSSFASALRAALRQDPDIILIGELRDKETIEIALQAAETGHLVLSTMHTIDAAETINRAVAVFPPHDQEAIRMLFADVLRWVISQRLMEKIDGQGRVPAVEVLKSTPRIRELIIGKAGAREIQEAIEKGSKVYGTQTFDQCLMGLCRARLIKVEDALAHCSNPSDFKLKLSGING
jgi:twitching motility protein PilT